jgi:hypothetical protein
MAAKKIVCPDCEGIEIASVDRRGFLTGVAAAAATTSALTVFATPRLTAAPTPKSAAETAVKALYEALTDEQKKEICFDWDHQHKKWGLLRSHVSNNWNITDKMIDSDFFTKKQRDILDDIFSGIFNPEWQKKIKKQLRDDSHGDFGHGLSCAIFGKPGDGKFEFVMTGRHLTVRADGDSESHVALGGPIFHGHQATDEGSLKEKPHHPNNIFWHQALLATKVYGMLDKEQQGMALVEARPKETAVGFHGADKEAKYGGIAVKGFNPDQKKGLQAVLDSLIEPYRKEDQEEVQACLKKQGGLDACYLSFFKDGNFSGEGEWDNWRLEGPSFVWYFRGEPHVHIWINVADDPTVATNA